MKDELIFNLFLINYYFSVVAEHKGHERDYRYCIDEYGYNSMLEMYHFIALKSAFPVNERCANFKEWFINYNYIKEE